MCFQPFAYAANRPAGADCGDEDVHFTVRVPPDLLSGCPDVLRRISRILELLQNDGARNLVAQRFRFGNGSFHPLRAGGEH